MRRERFGFAAAIVTDGEHTYTGMFQYAHNTGTIDGHTINATEPPARITQGEYSILGTDQNGRAVRWVVTRDPNGCGGCR